MSDLIELASHSVRTTINILLKDRSTAQNIIFATTAYDNINFASPITKKIIVGNKIDLRPRVAKTQEEKAERTRKKAEVFTPAWICNLMNNQCDNEWFGRENVFNVGDNIHWQATKGKVEFPDNKSWKDYVCSTRLEIACGEAPYLVSRYDAVTGEVIPIDKRVGILDRKLRVINENVKTHRTWNHWAYRAFESTYGYEYQGDNLLVARINLLETFCEYTRYRWHVEPSETSLKRIARIISWNLWQMDGISRGVPREEKTQSIDSAQQLLLFDVDEIRFEILRPLLPCKIRDWEKENGKRQVFWERGMDMKFDFVIGNPPYQDNTLGENETFAPPVYDKFMEAAYEVADKVELITPARFLFNAGSTPKKWNKKMLGDEHFKILYYEQDSSKVFSDTDIKGGVVITYHDMTQDFEAIELFTHFVELQSIMKKVKKHKFFKTLSDIVITRTAYRLTEKMHEEHPEAERQLSKGHRYDMSTNIFERLPQIFFDEKPNNGHQYVKILGRENNERVYKYVRREYINKVCNLEKYKIILPKSNGSGAIGEVLSTPLIGTPLIGTTESFISIGSFDTRIEAENALKYIKGKFSRTMLGILKITQDNPPERWYYVPLQDFTSSSDIDWSQSIADIDKQLYKKYNLSVEEIDFIESHVKEME